jgi:hypothetical protein
MPGDIMRWSKEWSAEDHASFEALCFHRVEETNEPYTELLRAPRANDQDYAAEIVKRAYEATKDEIAQIAADFAAERPHEIDPKTGQGLYRSAASVYALAIAKLCDCPGRVASLVSTLGPGLDIYECNTMHDRGGPLNSYYTGPFSSGAVWDSFHFFEDAYGEDTSVSFTTYHITKPGLDYCLERYPERVEKLRKAEETWKRNSGKR